MCHLKAANRQLLAWLRLPTHRSASLKGGHWQMREPAPQVCLSKELGVLLHKREPPLAISRREKYWRRKLLIHADIWEWSHEDGPLAAMSGSLRSYRSFSPDLTSCWPWRKQAHSRALAPLCSSHCEMPECSSLARILLHALHISPQIRAHMVWEVQKAASKLRSAPRPPRLHSDRRR